jgi:hypothetical protein
VNYTFNKLTSDLTNGRRTGRPPPPQGLARFPEAEVLPWFETWKQERPLIRQQAFGEALDPDKLEQLRRYDARILRPETVALMMQNQIDDLDVVEMNSAQPAYSNSFDQFPGQPHSPSSSAIRC